MGCDVHPQVEVEQYPGHEDAWVQVGDFHLWRNYRAFGLMAGVRGDETLFEARGYPPAMDAELTGDHTPSWLTTQEFRQVVERLETGGYQADYSYWALLAYMEEVEKRGKKARLVFNFDS